MIHLTKYAQVDDDVVTGWLESSGGFSDEAIAALPAGRRLLPVTDETYARLRGGLPVRGFEIQLDALPTPDEALVAATRSALARHARATGDPAAGKAVVTAALDQTADAKRD